MVSAGWIRDKTTPQVTRREGAYGYDWWLDTRVIDGRQIDLVAAFGWGGQNWSVVPGLDLVVAVTGGVYDVEGKGLQGLAGDTALEMAVRAVSGGLAWRTGHMRFISGIHNHKPPGEDWPRAEWLFQAAYAEKRSLTVD